MEESPIIWNRETIANRVEDQAVVSQVEGKETDEAVDAEMAAAVEVEAEAAEDKVVNPEAATAKVQQMESFIIANTQLK